MADFKRKETDFWRREVPGARWFKADLQIHTIDDLPGCNVKVPQGVDAPANKEADWSEDQLRAYARIFLQNAVKKGVRVLGLTPHRPRMKNDGSLSAVWQIVDEWNEGDDDDGKPFREKIYAVFPGFEPSLNDGRSGLHMLFLFDPEIGRKAYLRAFDLVMKNESAWKGRELRMSRNRPEDAFKDLREFHNQDPHWNYIALAPHIFSEKGLLKEQRAQVWDTFPHSEVAGLDLNNETLPEDALNDHRFLNDHQLKTKYQDAFFHSSDANSVEEIGDRYTWFKLASPRIEALPQAFLAADSRTRIAYERGENGKLIEISNPPNETAGGRPWLKSVEVKGEASFFGGGSGTRFDLSPDLTCVIGGSMTGKSTFLDGLRVRLGARLPENDESLSKQIEGRGRDRFLGGGSANVDLECPGSDPTAKDIRRWPAVFYSQNELQRIAQDAEAIETILARFAASETDAIKARNVQLQNLDRELRAAAQDLDELDEETAEAEQAFERSQRAVEELDAFSEAGIEELHDASRNLQRWQDSAEAFKILGGNIDSALQSAEGFDMPDIDSVLANLLAAAGVEEPAEAFRKHWKLAADSLRDARNEAANVIAIIKLAVSVLEANERKIYDDVIRKFENQGMDISKIHEFQALKRQAYLLESYQAHLHEKKTQFAATERSFEKMLQERNNLVEEQRAAFDRAIEAIDKKFKGDISARRIEEGDRQPLESFLRKMNQRGITRWWNDQGKKRPAHVELIKALENKNLGSVGMSVLVQNTFLESLSRSKRRELKAIRCRDRYLLESRVEEDNYRPLDQLSGGERVSLLLSLLLETNDETPLVIDQPEDELDNRFLSLRILPALKRLKGRRQIIIATHNANIVVNGDADQVILLEAEADKGWIAQAGAIEDPDVRNAIVQTVDGGADAFRLRRAKYKF